MKHASQTQHFRIALAHSVKASLLALALAAGAAGCKATQTPTQVDSPDAQTPPLTPQEWVQRNFQKPADKPVGQARTLMAELRPVPQTTNSSLRRNPRNRIPGPCRPGRSDRQSAAPNQCADSGGQPRASTQPVNPGFRLCAQAGRSGEPACQPRCQPSCRAGRVGKSAGQSTGFSGHPDQ